MTSLVERKSTTSIQKRDQKCSPWIEANSGKIEELEMIAFTSPKPTIVQTIALVIASIYVLCSLSLSISHSFCFVYVTAWAKLLRSVDKINTESRALSRAKTANGVAFFLYEIKCAICMENSILIRAVATHH